MIALFTKSTMVPGCSLMLYVLPQIVSVAQTSLPQVYRQTFGGARIFHPIFLLTFGVNMGKIGQSVWRL
jgi:hypothetical protein